jgi:hypothetical protein
LNTKKRLMALAVAGASAVVLGGAFGLSQHATTVHAQGPLAITEGCITGNNSSQIQFPFTLSGTAPNQTPSYGAQVAPTGLTATNINTFNFNTIIAGSSNVGITCSVLMADAPAATPGGAPGLDQDNDANSVDQGNVTYTLTGVGGRFALYGGNVFNGNSVVVKSCANTTGGVALPSGAPTFTSDACLGQQTTAGTPITAATTGFPITVVPNQSLAVQVNFAPGVALSAFGTLSGIAGSNNSFSLLAQYQRDPTLQGQLNAALITNQGPSSASVATTIQLLPPSYYLGLSANPTTIAANPTLNNSTPGVATTGNGGGSTITASLYTVVSGAPFVIGSTGTGQSVIVAPSGGIVAPSGAILTQGVEPGTVTFVTNNGIFGLPSSVQTSSQQTVSVACGALPGTGLTFNPSTFSFFGFGFSSCTTASTTLYGGGAAGTATVVATYVGSITGTQAQNAVTVALSAVANTQALARGCDEYITPASLAANTPIATLVGTVTPSSAVVSVWQYNNATQSFNALYFSTPGAPTNGNAVSGGQSVFICVNGPASIGNGAY